MKKSAKAILIFCLTGLLFSTSCQKKEIDGTWDGCVIGMFTAAENGYFPGDGISAIKGFEELIDHEVGSVVWFPTWEEPFPTEACKEAYKNGIIPHITWELFWPSENYNTAPVDSTGFHGFEEVLNGEHDAYIDSFATAAKEYGKIVLIRFMHEFNGNWYVWSGNKNGAENDGPERVVAVWKYVVDRFKAIGADNVKWLWVPHGPSIDLKEEEWNAVANYWPGDEYVDWIGLDAYNWYPKDPWGGNRPYRDFDNCFRKLYDDCAILGDQPMMIAEFASCEFEYDGIDKAAWITDAFNKIKTEYPRIKIFTWFHIKKELDWRVNSSPEALKAFQDAMDDTYYKGSVIK
ncbi:MAG: hypothetical protein JW894_04295 [Bacteroidales bacterium]|nr:hypothetical protein [Bacteroidales bacterium]